MRSTVFAPMPATFKRSSRLAHITFSILPNFSRSRRERSHSQTFRIPSGTLQNQNGFVFSESSLQLTKLGDRVRWEATIICELK